MPEYSIRPVLPEDREWIRSLLVEHWGSDFVVVHETVFYPLKLPGFIAVQGDERVGLITYVFSDPDCEIATLDCLTPSQGIGSALIDTVKTIAIRSGCRRLRLTTTNDNLRALHFYQKRGFILTALRPNTIEKNRKLKPIPLRGENGIPIRDEIDLEINLGD